MSELGQAQKEAWAAFLVSATRVFRKIDRDIAEAGGLSQELYDVLLCLEHAHEGRMRMSDLAEAVALTPSGITRLIDKLESMGLATRTPSSEDRRSTYAAITPEGAARRHRSWPLYEQAIDRHFGAYYSDHEALYLRDALRKLIPGVLLFGVEADELALTARREVPHQ